MKQKKLHRIPLSQQALDVLRRMRAEVDERVAKSKSIGRIVRVQPRLFPNASIDSFWRMVCAEAGIENRRIHDLRHSFASLLASGGASLPIIGAMLGHTQQSTTQRYSHLLDEPLRAAAEAVSKAVSQAKVRRPILTLPRKAI